MFPSFWKRPASPFDRYIKRDRRCGLFFFIRNHEFPITDALLDKIFACSYNNRNRIGQFETILSVNKTREHGMGAVRPFFVREEIMRKKIHYLTQAALIAALYAALSYLQNLLIPGSANWAIQFRASEALCVLALFTPAAIPGLSVGCLLFNLSLVTALPLDSVVGTAATALATGAMWLCRNWKLGKLPLFALLMPALFNGILVGWELAVYVGGGFWLNAFYVALGELAVLLTLGTSLYYALHKGGLGNRLFSR